jgi:hypothetical protein
MAGSAGLAAWLATMDVTELEALLRARPDVLRHPLPADLAALADRLADRASVDRALLQLSRPAVQVAEALLALGGSVPRHELLALLGADDEAVAGRVDAALDELRRLALAWPLADRVCVTGGWGAIAHEALGLGRSAHRLLRGLAPEQLERLGTHLGVPRPRAAGAAAVAAALTDPDGLAHRLARVDPDVAAAVHRVAWHGPRRSRVRFPDEGESACDGADVGVRLALQGWMVPTEWGIGEMPREIALAVRGPGYRAPFDPHPPRPATAPVDPAMLRAAGHQKVLAALESVRRLVALLDRAPFTAVASGGIGVRELRRAAKALGSDVDAVRLGLECAAAAELVAFARAGKTTGRPRRGAPPAEVALPTAAADEWLGAEPAEAAARLLLAWWGLPLVPTLRFDEAGRPVPALVRAYGHPELRRLRTGVLGALADLPAGRGLVAADAVCELLAHRAPLDRGAPGDTDRVLATVAEAERLGLVAAGALTPLGHALRDALRSGTPQEVLRAALAGALPAPTRTATFLPDLTALVAGTAAAPLTRLLDTAAVPEIRDTASVWRFTPESVGRALDAGRTAEQLLEELAAAAAGPLPQPLGYLVHDVARRRGQIQVAAAATCVRVADAALGAELAVQRALAPLALRPLADTVLISPRPVAEVLEALRAAGYTPVQQDAGGTPVVATARPRRAPAAVERIAGAPLDLAALAAQLRGAA